MKRAATSTRLRRLFSRALCLLGGGQLAGQLFLDTRRLAAALTQIVQLGAADVAAALDFDAGDQGAVGLERALHAFAAGDLAHREAAVQAAVALGDHDAFVGLHALAGAFDDAHRNDHRVAGGEIGDALAQTGDFLLLEGLDQVHGVLKSIVPRAFRRDAWRAEDRENRQPAIIATWRGMPRRPG